MFISLTSVQLVVVISILFGIRSLRGLIIREQTTREQPTLMSAAHKQQLSVCGFLKVAEGT